MNITLSPQINNYQNNNVSFQGNKLSKSLLRELIGKGFSNSKIAAEYGLSPDDVYSSLQKFGLKSARAVAIEKRNDKIFHLYKQGFSVDVIAKKLTIDSKVVKTFLEANNLPVDNNMRYLAWVEDKTLRAIIEKMKLPKMFVYKNLK